MKKPADALTDLEEAELVLKEKLEAVLDRFKPKSDPIWLVYPSTRHLSAKVRAFVDFMVSHVR